MDEQLQNLILKRLETPNNDARLSTLDSQIIPLLQQARPCMLESHSVLPSVFDVMLSDVKLSHLKGDIAYALNTSYLSRVSKCPLETSVHGILFGMHARPFINLVVEHPRFNVPINVTFLIDTGSPFVYVSEETMTALGFADYIPDAFNGLVHGSSLTINMSPVTSHFKDVNVLGAAFLLETHANLRVDYRDKTVMLDW